MIAVVTQDPKFGGGASAQTGAFVDAARALGREVVVEWVPHPALNGRRLTLDRVEALRQLRGGRALARQLSPAAAVWVVATMAPAGLAATYRDAPYDCWLGTSVDAEWHGRRRSLGRAHAAAFAASLPVLRRLERHVIRGARRVFATSRASRRSVAEAGGVAEDAIAIFPLPVDLDAFRPEEDAAWQARLERPVLGFVGRANDPRKNVRLLLDALPLLRRSLPDATVRLIGTPPPGPLPDGVEAVGEVVSVADHLRTVSLFVLPSWQEGFGIAAAEALAAGVPVLTTPCGGPEELVERSGAGRVLAGFDPAELAEAAATLLGDAGTLVSMRAAGRAYVAREHSPARLRELLDQALSLD